jgi:hypothetical protein
MTGRNLTIKALDILYSLVYLIIFFNGAIEATSIYNK